MVQSEGTSGEMVEITEGLLYAMTFWGSSLNSEAIAGPGKFA